MPSYPIVRCAHCLRWGRGPLSIPKAPPLPQPLRQPDLPITPLVAHAHRREFQYDARVRQRGVATLPSPRHPILWQVGSTILCVRCSLTRYLCFVCRRRIPRSVKRCRGCDRILCPTCHKAWQTIRLDLAHTPLTATHPLTWTPDHGCESSCPLCVVPQTCRCPIQTIEYESHVTARIPRCAGSRSEFHHRMATRDLLWCLHRADPSLPTDLAHLIVSFTLPKSGFQRGP